jgi:hypothetical protein
LCVCQAFGDLVHHGGGAATVFESFHLRDHVIAGQACDGRHSRAFDGATFGAMTVGAHGGIGLLMQTGSVLGGGRQGDRADHGTPTQWQKGFEGEGHVNGFQKDCA